MRQATTAVTGQSKVARKPIERRYLAVFSAKIAFIILTSAVAIYLFLYIYLDRPLGQSYLEALAQLSHTRTELLRGVILTVALQICLATACLAAASVFWTHKVAGPLYRLRLWLSEVGKGRLIPFGRLRRGDQLQDLPESLNAAVEAIGHRTCRIREEINTGEQLLQEMMERLDEGADVPASELLKIKEGLISAHEKIKSVYEKQ